MTAATNLEERTVDHAGAGVRYFVGGRGEPLVLLHGLGGAASNWVELVPAAAERYRVLAIDLPGHAGSAPPRRGAGVAEFADAVAAVLEAEGAGPALVAGHSFGGLVALRLAQRRPELVRGLLLVAPAGIASATRAARVLIALTGWIRPGRFVAPFRHRLAGHVWYRRALFRPFFVSDPYALSERATHGFLEGPADHRDVRAAGRALVADDARRDLERVVCPVLLVWGARDAQLPLDDAFEYARRLGARLRVVADCGHLVIGERPEACLDALAALERSL